MKNTDDENDQHQKNKGRWKKGQCGNPRSRKAQSLDIRAIIEKCWSKRVFIKQGGRRRRVTRFEAIMLQLSAKAMAGSRRAHKVLMRYVAFAASQSVNPGVVIRFREH